MNKETGSSTIGFIAIVVIAILVGIWIGAKKDMIILEMKSAPSTFQSVINKDTQNLNTLDEEAIALEDALAAEEADKALE